MYTHSFRFSQNSAAATTSSSSASRFVGFYLTLEQFNVMCDTAIVIATSVHTTNFQVSTTGAAGTFNTVYSITIPLGSYAGNTIFENPLAVGYRLHPGYVMRLNVVGAGAGSSGTLDSNTLLSQEGVSIKNSALYSSTSYHAVTS